MGKPSKTQRGKKDICNNIKSKKRTMTQKGDVLLKSSWDSNSFMLIDTLEE